MNESYRNLLEAIHMFHNLNLGQIMPHLSKNEYFMMSGIQCMQKRVDTEELPGIAMTKLAQKVHALPPAVSRTIKSLEERGYVARYVNPKDRRNTMVRLTEEGEQVLEESRELLKSFADRVFAQTDEMEMQRACAYFKNLYELAEAEVRRMKAQKRNKEDETK